MGRIVAKPFVANSGSASGVTLALRETKQGQHLFLSINAAAQKSLFGGPLDTEKDGLALFLDDDVSKRHLLAIERRKASDPEAVAISGSLKGSVNSRVALWRQVAGGKRPAVSLPIVTQSADLVLVKLPDWARPDPKKPKTPGMA